MVDGVGNKCFPVEVSYKNYCFFIMLSGSSEDVRAARDKMRTDWLESRTERGQPVSGESLTPRGADAIRAALSRISRSFRGQHPFGRKAEPPGAQAPHPQRARAVHPAHVGT